MLSLQRAHPELFFPSARLVLTLCTLPIQPRKCCSPWSHVGHLKDTYPMDSSVSSATVLVIWVQSQQMASVCSGTHILRLLCWLLISEGATLATASPYGEKRSRSFLITNNSVLGFGFVSPTVLTWGLRLLKNSFYCIQEFRPVTSPTTREKEPWRRWRLTSAHGSPQETGPVLWLTHQRRFPHTPPWQNFHSLLGYIWMTFQL